MLSWNKFNLIGSSINIIILKVCSRYSIKNELASYFCSMIEDKNQQRTPLSNLGEFGLIEHLTKNLKLRINLRLKELEMMLLY